MTIQCWDKITHLFRRLLLQPSAGLLDKRLIVITGRAITDDRNDTVLEIFLGRCNIIVVGATGACRVSVGSLWGNIEVEEPHSARIKIATTQRAG
jgi:hypothetical protein